LGLNQGYEYREQIDARGAGLTVREYLAAAYRHSSEAEWTARLENGEVCLDGRRVQGSVVLKPGQWLVWRRPPWEEPDVPLAYAVLYSDEDLLAVAKPRGLPTVPAGGFLDNTLLALVRRICPEATPVHRLGRGTSGIVLLARTARARSVLAAALRRSEVTRTYRALAGGLPGRDAFTVGSPIGPVPHPLLGSVHAANPAGRPALSLVEVLERRTGCSLVGVRIKTGRPHQIRIHLACAGHPLLGDPLYAPGGVIVEGGCALPGDPGYLLHAESLRLLHPATGEPFELWCRPPPELRLRSE